MPKVKNTTTAYDSSTNKYLNTQRATGMPEVADNVGTLPVTTTNIEIWCNGAKVGFVQSFNPSESRTIKPITELGTEGVVQMMPMNTNGGTIALSRIALYNSSLFNALGMTRTGQFANTDLITRSATTKDATYKTYANIFKSLKDHRVPLELQSKTKLPSTSTDAERVYVLTYTDVWIQQYSKSYSGNDVTVTENATASYSDVYSGIVTSTGDAAQS